jgi:hypothetical protein
MRKPVYLPAPPAEIHVPTIEQWNQMQSDREQMRTFREQLRILALTLAVGMVGAVFYFM